MEGYLVKNRDIFTVQPLRGGGWQHDVQTYNAAVEWRG
jgi:hypothetical protein